MPVDSNELIALCAPRLVFISYGIPEKGDAKWLDHQGSYMATVAAQPVYKLLGAKDLGVTEDYRTAKMPRYECRACSMASLPGGSTTAATPMRRTLSTSSNGPTNSSTPHR